jgi:hypothetical protein
MQTRQDAAVNNDSTADACSKNDSKNNRGLNCRPDEGFGEGKAIGIVCHQNPGASEAFQILPERPGIQTKRVGIF